MKAIQSFANVALCLFLLATSAVAASAAAPHSTTWRFFAFDNGVGRGKWEPEEQANVLADLGYQGIGYTGVKEIPAMLKALRAHKGKMFSTYVQLNIKDGVTPYDPLLPKAITQLKGEGTALWIHIHGDATKSATQDQRAVKLIREIAEMAKASGLPVVLYPHTGFYVATTSDAVRMVKLVDRKNVGASFNLCHFLKQNDAHELEQTLRDAMPHLMLVSINGTDAGDTKGMGWDRLIQTLNKGTFDVGRVLTELERGGYDGPIGLQCYAIKGDIRDNLAQSIQAWRKLNQPAR